MKLVSFKICPFVQRIAALLEAKQIPYEIEYISLKESPQWFLDISPNAQVPVLITDSGEALFESEAIADYLDEIHSPIEVDLSPEQRAIDKAWAYQPSILYIPQCWSMQSEDEETLQARKQELDAVFGKVEAQLNGGPYYKGSELSNLDIAWLPVLHRAAIIEKHTGYDFMAGYPRLKSLQNSLLDSGLAEKSVPEDFENVFTAFYLSDKTFLGRMRDLKITPHSADLRASMCG